MKSVTLALLVATGLAGAAFAQSGAPIKLADVAELSGAGATVGTNWKNGIDLAISEINAKGGVLGRKLEVTHADSQSNPGVARAQVQKALDDNPYVLLGPGYSGSIKVTAPLAKKAGIAADHGRRGGRSHPGRQRVHLPHLVRRPVEHAEDREIHRATTSRRSRSRSSRSTTISARAAATSSARISRSAASRSSPTSRPNPARPISPPTSARSRPPMPTRCSSISTRTRARAS